MQKKFLRILFMFIFSALAALPANARDELVGKFESKLYSAEGAGNPCWIKDLNQAIDIALELAKTQNCYAGISDIGSFLLDIKDYKNALTFLELAAENKEMLAWCEIARMHFQGLGVPKDAKKGNYFLEKGLEHCALFIKPGEGIEFDVIKGFYKTPIEYEIKRLPNPQGILKNFEDCGYTFNVKESKEYLFGREVKEGYRYACYLPITLAPEQLEKAKGRPCLAPEAHIVRLFSNHKEEGSDVEQLADVETIKKKLKVLYRDAGETCLSFQTKENSEWTPEYFYKYLGGLSNGLQLLFCVYYPDANVNWNTMFRIAAFQAKKAAGAGSEIDIAFMDTPCDEPYMPFFYVENDTLVEVKHDYSLVFHTLLPEDEFRKTKLPAMLKKIEERRKTETVKRRKHSTDFL